MESSNFNKAISELRQEAVQIESHAREMSARFQALGVKAELLKIDILKWELKRKVESLARQAGYYMLMGKNRRNLGIGLLAGVAGLILGGVVYRDKLSALAFAMAGVDGIAQGFGSEKWVVSLDKDLIVAPWDRKELGRTWVTMESLITALGELREKACNGEKCGNLGSMLKKLKQKPSKLVYLLRVSQSVAIPRDDGVGD